MTDLTPATDPGSFPPVEPRSLADAARLEALALRSIAAFEATNVGDPATAGVIEGAAATIERLVNEVDRLSPANTVPSAELQKTIELLPAIAARAEAATDGDWQVCDHGSHGEHSWVIEDIERWRGMTNNVHFGSDRDTAEFVAHSRADVPDLVALATWLLAERSLPPQVITIHTGNPDEILASWIEGYNEATRQHLAAEAGESDDVISGMVDPVSGIVRIATELARQASEDGPESKSDDSPGFDLIAAASAYLSVARYSRTVRPPEYPSMGWPWKDRDWKPTGDAITDLTVAGAQIARAIDILIKDKR